MGKLFTEFEMPTDIKEEGDFLGGNAVMESCYSGFVVDTAYSSTSAGGATAMNVVLKTADGKQQLRQQFWMSSGTAKGCLPYYTTKDGEKKFLPGFILANHLCMLAAGKQLALLTPGVPIIDTEERAIMLYSPKESKELLTKVDMFTDLLGKPIAAGVIKQIVDKTKKNDMTGQYEPTGETREENEIVKFFHHRDGRTVTEITAKLPAAIFKDQWVNKWEGQTRDKSTKSNGIAGVPGVPGKVMAPTVADNMFA